MPVKGEPGIESSTLWDDPGFMACPPPHCSPLSSSIPVVGLAQALLSRPWHRIEPVAKEDLVRGGAKSAHTQQQLFEHQAPPTSNHALPQNPVSEKPAGPDLAGEEVWSTIS